MLIEFGAVALVLACVLFILVVSAGIFVRLSSPGMSK